MTTRELPKILFRRLFTGDEQKAVDRFNATFESHPLLTSEQKDDIRTGLENYRAAGSVDLDDPDTAAMLGLYTMLGILEAGRAQEILAGPSEPEEPPVETTPPSVGVYLLEGQITIVSEGEDPPDTFLKFWPLSPEVAALVDSGAAQVRVNGDSVEIVSQLV